MKRIIMFLLAILMLLYGCAYADPVPPTTEPTQITETPTTELADQSTEPSIIPTQPPTEQITVPTESLEHPTEPFLWVRNSFQEVYVYPYTQEDIDSAMEALRGWFEEYKSNEYVLNLEVHWFAFDPVALDVRMVQYDPLVPVELVEHDTVEDNYRNTLYLQGWHTSEFDGTKVPYSSYENMTFHTVLYRESPESPWQHYESTVGFYVPTGYWLIPPNELEMLNLTDQRIIAGYFIESGATKPDGTPVPYEQDTYVLYVVDEESNTVICREYPAE